MMVSGRLLAVAAALNLTVCVGVAAAQTVIVRNAPLDSTIEVFLNDTPVGTAKPNDKGDALVPVGITERLMKSEIDAQVFVDVCPTARRVHVLERAVIVPLPEAGCTRRDMGGIFVVRPVSSLVVDVAGASPTLLLRQGNVSLDPPRVWKPAPTGLVIFGGGGLTKLGDVTGTACGDLTSCSGDQSNLGFTVGAAYWLTPFLAAEGSYIKAGEATATASTDTYRFTSLFNADVFTVVGKVGIPVGPVRPYGQVGGSYQQSKFRTEQEQLGDVDPKNLTYEMRTKGWGLVFGGGVEVWLSSVFAFYGEVGNVGVKGKADDDEEGQYDDRMWTFLGGIRVRLGG